MNTLYEDVAEHMRFDVLSRALSSGEALETTALMHRYRTSRPTVERACLMLQQEGLLERRGEARVVTDDPARLTKARELLVRHAIRELLVATRQLGLDDYRTVRIFLEEGGHDGAKG